MKAVIIACVSTEEQKEAGLSLPAQVIRLENYCQNKGFPMIKSFSFDESAYKDDRSEFDTIRDKIGELNTQLSKLQEAEDNYYITAKYILDLSTRAYELFKSSEVEKKQLIKLILSNLRLSGKNLLFDAEKPFDLILNFSDHQVWYAR